MGIKAAFMVPHPPLIVPEVGKGGEKEILDTTNAYERVAKKIAEIAPDTIVITSPHSVMYGDYFHVSPGAWAVGSFANFGAPKESGEIPRRNIGREEQRVRSRHDGAFVFHQKILSGRSDREDRLVGSAAY